MYVNYNSTLEHFVPRELQPILEYKQWWRFAETIGRAKEACENSNNKVSDHFAKVGKMKKIGYHTKSVMQYRKLKRLLQCCGICSNSRQRPYFCVSVFSFIMASMMSLVFSSRLGYTRIMASRRWSGGVSGCVVVALLVGIK